MTDRSRWWEFPNLFDLVGGALLDKRLLAQGVRTGSLRRYVVTAMAVVVFRRVWLDPTLTWQHVVLVAVVIFALDLQGAIAAAPKVALKAIGDAIGQAAGGLRSGYQFATSAWGSPGGLPPVREDPPTGEPG